MKKSFFSGWVGGLLLVSPQISNAQDCTDAMKQDAVKSIATTIAGHYYDVEKGKDIASHLQQESDEGHFRNAKDWKEFDDRVSKSLSAYGKDGHLFVKYDPETVAALKTQSAPGDAEGNLNTGEKKAENYGISETTVLDGDVGYLKLSAIRITKESVSKLQATMNWFKNTKAMIIDLRDNEGGGSDLGPVLESFFLPAGEPLLSYKNRNGDVRTDSTLSWISENRYQNPVYIIVNKRTASAAEAFAFTLQEKKRAQIIGERTAGAANINERFVVNDGNYVSVSTESPSLAGKNISWEQKGISPDLRIKGGDPVSAIVSKLHQN